MYLELLDRSHNLSDTIRVFRSESIIKRLMFYNSYKSINQVYRIDLIRTSFPKCISVLLL